MEETASKEVLAFIGELVRLNGTLAKLFQSGDVTLFSELNKTVKEMYRLQHGSGEEALTAIDGECNVIYRNFDMIVAVLRTTEDGVIDAGAQTALNKFLHNIDDASVKIAVAFGLV